MLTKSKIQYIRTLHERKTRHELGLFLVEWRKSIEEVLRSDLEIVEGYVTHDFIPEIKCDFPIELITERELDRLSTLKSNHDGILIVRMPRIPVKSWDESFILVLDGINDPWNLGTILRIADWYDIDRVVLSENTVDLYNPKTIIASMGSFARVPVSFEQLSEFLKELKKKDYVLYGAFLEGKNIHTLSFESWTKKCLVIGSESHGISPEGAENISERITIPRFWSAESLNAGVATAILVDRMKDESL